MSRITAFFRSFLGLRGKLTLTYTLVTVSAMLAIEIVGIAMLLALYLVLQRPEVGYVQDIAVVLPTGAVSYLETDQPDLTGLQAWLDDTWDEGYASLQPTSWTDSPAAPISKSHPMYVLALDGTILAAAPDSARDDIGKAYRLPDIPLADLMLANAREGELSGANLYNTAADGTLYVMVPVLNRSDEPIGMIALYVDPPPSWLLSVGPTLLGIVLLTAFILILGIMPFATLFGFIMSRGLTRRLSSLSQAADVWSRGDFSVVPKDRARDELGDLQDRLIHMATQLQDLIQTRQELAGLEERNRLARELHDTVKQQLFAAAMQLRAANNRAETDPAALKTHLGEVEKLLKTSQSDLTMIINEMRPAALEGQSLVTALRSYLEMWSQHTGIAGEMQVHGERSLSISTERALYRVVQEALANTAKHSRASRATIMLRYTSEYITLSVEDNGQGFDASQLETTGFGLQTMRQRIAELGGTLTITSQADSGTTVWAEIPLQRNS